MTTPLHSPGPREGLDEGSLAQLAQDGREFFNRHREDLASAIDRGREVFESTRKESM